MTAPANEPAVQVDGRLSDGSLGRTAAGNVAWGYASFILAKLLVFASTAVLARLLTPGEFGIVGFALVIIGWLDLTRDLGVGAALIARPAIDRRIASTAWITTIAWSALLTLALFFGAPAIGQFFASPALVPVAQLLSLSFVITALGSVHDALLYRDLVLHRRIVPEVCQALTKGIVSLVLALAGFGYWSLVYGQLAGQLVFVLAAWGMHPFRPTVAFDGVAGRGLLAFGSKVVATRLTTAAFISLTFVVVGRELGAEALGIFTIAYSIADLLLVNTFVLLSTTLFPVFARLQDDPSGLRRGALIVQRYLGLVAFPLGLGVLSVAPLFVDVVYGPKWLAAGPVLQLLAIRGTISAIGWHAGDVGKALGRAGLQLRLTVLSTVLLAPFLPFSATTSGLPGVGALLVVSGCVAVGLSIMLMRRLLGISLRSLLIELRPGILVGVVVLLVANGMLVAGSTLPPVVRLGAAISLAGLIGGLVALLAAPDTLVYLRPPLRRLRRLIIHAVPS